MGSVTSRAEHEGGGVGGGSEYSAYQAVAITTQAVIGAAAAREFSAHPPQHEPPACTARSAPCWYS